MSGAAITLVTYNVHSFIGTDRRVDPARVAAVIRETGADVVALQEVGDFRGRTPSDAPERLARELDLPMLFSTTVVANGRRYGNAILTRLPVLATGQLDLSVGALEPRKALRVELRVASERLALFCVHAGLLPLEHGAQVSRLAKRVLAEVDGPTVVCGDFNSLGIERDPRMERRGLRDVAIELDRPERTFPSRRPFLRLDRVYCNGLVGPLDIHVHRSAASAMASDHLPLVCRFEVSAGPS